ncbi:MAG: arylesterase [Devosia sp.]|uniref:SGNH/GDSL hydrolase family protein n=1 Tax=Devosia sp. TaxID=1871048 RepID=UPI00262CD2F8|nr:SGNH/GDSL hydrolase family protein [Devosia sp.]MDB5530233.1 arylesterase [Devosia sp.]
MKTVLAFGDSLTFGTNAATLLRHAYEDRWPSALEAGLTGRARVIAEGLGGRTTMFDDYSTAADRNGARVLPTLLATHTPLDAVVIMLGSNDLKPFICGKVSAIAVGMRRLVQIVQTHPYDMGGTVPAVIIVAPPHCGPSDNPDGLPVMDRSIEEWRKLASVYAKVAQDNGAYFFDASTVATPSRVDGVHLDGPNTRAIGVALVLIVEKALGL